MSETGRAAAVDELFANAVEVSNGSNDWRHLRVPGGLRRMSTASWMRPSRILASSGLKTLRDQFASIGCPGAHHGTID